VVVKCPSVGPSSKPTRLEPTVVVGRFSSRAAPLVAEALSSCLPLAAALFTFAKITFRKMIIMLYYSDDMIIIIMMIINRESMLLLQFCLIALIEWAFPFLFIEVCACVQFN